MVKAVSKENLIRYFIKEMSLTFLDLQSKQKQLSQVTSSLSYKQKMQILLEYHKNLAKFDFLTGYYFSNNPTLRDLAYSVKTEKRYENLKTLVTDYKIKAKVYRQNFNKFQNYYQENLISFINKEVFNPILEKSQTRLKKNYCKTKPNELFFKVLNLKNAYKDIVNKSPYEFYNLQNDTNKIDIESQFLGAYCKDQSGFGMPKFFENRLKDLKTLNLKYGLYSPEFQEAYKKACELTENDLIKKGCSKNLVNENFLYSLSQPTELIEVKSDN
jgi:hypothetical protein